MKDGYKDIYPASVEPGNLDSPTGLDEIRPGRLKQSLSLYSTMSPTTGTGVKNTTGTGVIKKRLDDNSSPENS